MAPRHDLLAHSLLLLSFIVALVDAAIIPRTSSIHRKPTNGALLPLKRIPRARGGNLYTASNEPSARIVDIAGSHFAVEVNFGGQSTDLVLDTGSSDTFVVTPDFLCFNATNHAELPQAACMLGPGLNESSIAFQEIPDQNLYNRYGGVDIIYGRLGYTNLTVGGLTIQNQEVGLVNETAWNGDGVSSGVLGMAYSTLTSAYPTTNFSTDNATTNRMHYPSFIERFVQNYTDIQPIFTVAMSRDQANNTNGGTLTFGGLPDLTDPTVNASSTFAQAPLEILQKSISRKHDNPGLQYYTISATTTDMANETQFLVDTGTTTIYIPGAAAAAYNAKFDPPTYGFDDYGIYFVNCTATPPPFNVTVDGLEFNINPLDLVVLAGPGVCASGVQSAGTIALQPSILGEVFLKNVLAVFDVGTAQMRFSAREFYQS